MHKTVFDEQEARAVRSRPSSIPSSRRSGSTAPSNSISRRTRPPPRAASTRSQGEEILEANRKRLAHFQEKLYAQDRWSLLLIFQGMDASGKDSAIKSVFDGINPQGCEVTSFKQPSLEGARSRFYVAEHDRAARARPHRHLQSLLLRGVPGDAGASGGAAGRKAAVQARHQKHLARALRGHYRVRALSRRATAP